MPVIRFEPEGVSLEVAAGTTVLAAARRAGVPLAAACGGRKACGTCAVRVLDGALAAPNAEEAPLIASTPGIRLGCRAQIVSDVVVRPVLAVAGAQASAVEGGDATDLAVGCDVGTTSIAVTVYDARSGAVRAEASGRNAQDAWGADILTRLSVALADSGEAVALRDAVQNSVLDTLERALGSAGASFAAIRALVLAGNSVSAGLLCGSPPEGLAHAPFTAPEDFHLDAGPLSDAFAQRGCVDAVLHVVSPLGAFVGGDMRAGLLGTNLLAASDDTAPGLLVDMGTNVETALVVSDRVIVASAPAGSAFAAAGQAGSHVLEDLAALRRAGTLTRAGLLESTAPGVSVDAAGIRRVEHGGTTYTQTAIREFQLAKATLGLGIAAVCAAAGIDAAALYDVVVTGAFAQAVEPSVLRELGIVPAAVDPEAVRFVPNASVLGAGSIALRLARAANGMGELGMAEGWRTDEAVPGPQAVEALDRRIEVIDFTADPAFATHLMEQSELG